MAATGNLRKIRLKENGRWTLFGKIDEGKLTQPLCGFCAIEDSCLATRRMTKVTDEFGLVAGITECAMFRPTLVFRRPLLGLDGSFNTIRLGAAWAARVKTGALVTLWDSADNKLIGEATVTAVHVGKYLNIGAQHAPYNHMLLGQQPADAYRDMLKILTRSYGTTFMTEDRVVSVIYLRREK